MPLLPEQLFEKYTTEYGLSDYDAGVLTADHDIALYFDQLTDHIQNYKSAANWLMGAVKSWLNDHHSSIAEMNLTPQKLAGIIQLVDAGTINHNNATQKLFPAVIKEPSKSAAQLAGELNLLISDNKDELEQFIQDALAKFPDKVKEFKKGKKGVLGLFMGEIMKRSKGKIDPQKTNQLLLKALEA
jgi:aspartyl-tRNA(Asn)/glutamyl-tRNA(Gln) amidotransferase subunit B